MSRNLDLSTLVIKRIIVHDIPKHRFKDFEIEPQYSERIGTLTDGLRGFFKTKIAQALSSDRSIKIIYDEESESPVSSLAEQELASTSNPTFIPFSQNITRHLFTIQKGNNSGGIIVIMDSEINGRKCVIVMKLEKDNGVQIKMNEETNSLDIEVVDDLMLTQKTKVFKIALLISRTQEQDYDGQIMDYQVDLKQKSNLATFFMYDFLGSKPYKDPKTTTQQFYNLTKAFIRNIDDDILKAKYTQDLNSYIQMNNRSISARTFADDYLENSQHKDEYISFLRSKHFTIAAFIKDNSLIENKVKKISMEFTNGITILGTKGTLENKVTLSEARGGNIKAEIVSKLKSVN